MKHVFLGALCAFVVITPCIPVALADDSETIGVKREEADEIIVTASRHEEKVLESPYIAEVISAEEIQNQQMSRTTPEIFSSDPSITVQKTSQGQGAPFLRGFTGFRTLFMIDGVRLNNSAFRDGPNEYWNTVDSFTIGQLEIVKGPSSVLYGSDSIGGAVNALTPVPEKDGWHGRMVQRYSSADKSAVTRLESSYTVNKSLSFIAGASGKDFGDLAGGRYVGLQPETGYRENDYDIRLDYKLSSVDKLVLVYQKVTQPDAWRTHSTVYGISWRGTAIGTDKERSLDHARELFYVQYHKDEAGWMGDKAKFSFSYQAQDEEQFRLRSNDKIETQGFTIGTAGFFAQAECKSSLGYLSYGVEFYRDNANSFARNYKSDGTLESIGIQGSIADNATYDMGGVYIQDEYALTQKMTVTAGTRYTKVDVSADKGYDPNTKKQISLEDNWSSLVGNLRLAYLANENWNIFGGVSQGFRAPNLSDLSRLDIALSNEIEMPSPGLKPEYFTTIETGAKARYETFSVQGAVFHTNIKDMIVRYPTGNVVSGKNEVQKANIGDGFIYGGELSGKYEIDNQWSIFAGAGCQRGAVDTYPTSALVKEEKPMSKIPPPAFTFGGRWENVDSKTWLEGMVKIADRQDRLSPLDKLDTQRIPPDGTPGYTIYNLKGGTRLNKYFNISAGVENITGRDYRIHGSGNNESGTNFIVTIEGLF
ncbi:MAG: TonB-dependent receptor [Planctomycetes bacterium]|nr:TonB-dependent receptor [Planctomycetota bacterium]